jgi:tetratricopeptide (TPR) repeat protein
MKKISAIFFVFLLFTISVLGQTETRASKTWEVEKYDITATLPTVETDRYLNVKAVLNMKNASGSMANSLTLRISPNAEIGEVKVNNTATSPTKGEEKIGGGTLQRIILRSISIQPNGNLAVEVNYKLKVIENSGLNALSPVNSQFLPLSYWYPTPNSWFFTRGGDFAPFSVKVNNSAGLMMISSGGGNANSFDQKLFGQPFFITGNWDTINANSVSVLVNKGTGGEEQKRANELATLASEAKIFMEKSLGGSFDAPLRIVSVRRGGGFSGGGTILIDENVFRRQKIDSQTALTVADAIAKVWFGNIVKVEGDGYGAIREGLSKYLATQFLESKYGKEIADIERLRQRTAYTTVIKRDAPLTLSSPIDGYYYTTNSNKGAMIWRLLARKIGQDTFFDILKNNLKNRTLELANLRGAFSQHKELLDYNFDQLTDIDLLIGLPRVEGGETKIALRNAGSIEVTVEITATTEKGEKLKNNVAIAAKSFGETTFKSTNKIVRVEIDSEKLFPQTDYSNDVKPQEVEETDMILFIKKAFDRQDYITAEKNGRIVLRDYPLFDDARILLARALFAQGKNLDAEKEFRTAYDEKLPTARTLAWANVGLGEIALKNGQTAQAIKFFDEAIKANGENGATLQARQGKIKANGASNNDESVKAFFNRFDKAAISGSKANLEALMIGGDTPKEFAGGIAGQAQEWTTRIVQIDALDANNMLVEVALNFRIINKESESGTAVFRLTKIGGDWKLSGVEIFEVR